MMLNGADEDVILAISSVMQDVGLAFQIQDDIMGIYADAEELGKDVGSDIVECKQTFMYTFVRIKKPEALPELKKYYGKDEVTYEGLCEVRRIFKETGAYRFAYDKMEYHYNRAKNFLLKNDAVSEEGKALIAGFIEYLESRRK